MMVDRLGRICKGGGDGIRVGRVMSVMSKLVAFLALVIAAAAVVDAGAAAAFQAAPSLSRCHRMASSKIGASLQTPTESASSSMEEESDSEEREPKPHAQVHHLPHIKTNVVRAEDILNHHATTHNHHQLHDHHQLHHDQHHHHHGHHHQTIATVGDAIITPAIPSPSTPVKSHVLTVDEMNPILKFEKNGKQKILNATGLYHLFAILVTMPFWLLAMETLHWLGDNLEGFDPNRSKFDYSGKVWCRAYLRMTNCYPEIAGDVARLKVGPNGKSDTGACLFVANHASFLDIAVLCCVLDPVFKFIAKDSLKQFPGVGRQLVGGEHVLIDRTDKRSQLRTFKQAISYLKDGVPIMAFPEGARSPDGRLMSFKPGIFSMAVKAKVPIVPLSLANTHAVMPGVGFLPVQSGEGKLRVYVHDPIGVEGKSEEEIAREVREALLSELPSDQHPLPGEEGGG